MQFNRLFPKSALDVLDKFPSNEPIVYNEETDTFSLLDTSDLRDFLHRFHEYGDWVCSSPDTAMRAVALQHLLRILFRDDFECAWPAVGILDVATRGKVHERALFVLVELLMDLEVGRYSLSQLKRATEELAQQNSNQLFIIDTDDAAEVARPQAEECEQSSREAPSFYMEL
jgi:hypothetical protein